MTNILSCIFSTNIATLGPFLTIAASFIVIINLLFFAYMLRNIIQKKRKSRQKNDKS